MVDSVKAHEIIAKIEAGWDWELVGRGEIRWKHHISIRSLGKKTTGRGDLAIQRQTNPTIQNFVVKVVNISYPNNIIVHPEENIMFHINKA